MMGTPKFTNKLIGESSPYLLQHAHNPVEWHPWNEATLAKARSLDKMLLISIGYAACHWCHVMEKESFMDEGVAEIMNKHFLCIKVDREERPDIDQVYMSAVQLITGGGGWPLNCFALPDGRPFFGGTYFRKEQWIQLLENVSLLFKAKRKDLEEQAGSLTKGIASNDLIESPGEITVITSNDLHTITDRLKSRFDSAEGGLHGAPKFPMPALLSFLLNDYFFTKNEDNSTFLRTTLYKMSFGGIYDQAGGGFARYSTDSQWKVPHFEKMLYDNAQLVSLYSRAYQRWQDTLFKETALDTLEFISREMTHPEGGFYSSMDADSEGVEGKYYTWGTGEFKKVLETTADIISRYYHVGGKGLWEDGRNILIRDSTAEEFAPKVGLQPSQFRNMVKAARSKLLKIRRKRIPPALDDKILTSWNALMMKGFIDAYTVFAIQEYLEIARKNAEFLIREAMQADGRLYHNWREGKVSINGFLEDYCFLAEGLIELYQATFEERYLEKSLLLTEYALEHFYDPENGIFYLTSSLDPPLVARKHEVYDGVIPSSNSVMARVLFLLGLTFERDDLLGISSKMVQIIREKCLRFPTAFSNWASVMLNHVHPFHTIAITGPNARETATRIGKKFHPSLFFCGSETESSLPILKDRFVEGQTLIFVCTGRECRLPTSSVEEAIRYLNRE